jgi:hypothetical protein
MAQRPADRTVIERAARELIAGAAYGTLITLGLDGHPQAPHGRQLPPNDFTVWIGTNPRTRKVAEIRRDPRVTLHCSDPKRQATSPHRTRPPGQRLHGEGSPLETGMGGLLPDRNRDYLLVEVRPLRLEVVSPSQGITGDSLTWRPPTVDLRPPARRP